jgi:hypothetical protein
MTTDTIPAAESVRRTLADHPQGITVRDLASRAGVSVSATHHALSALQTHGQVRQIVPAAVNGRRPAALWHLSPDTATPAATAEPQMDPDTPSAPSVVPAPTGDPTPPPPVPTAQPDLKVLIMAGVLGTHPQGIPASTAIAESGLAPAVGDRILTAMEIAGAARRLPGDDEEPERWVRGEADLAQVDPEHVPTHVTCPTCGHTRRIRRPSATRRPGTTGTDEINSDGSPRLRKGDLRDQVEAFLRTAGEGHGFTPSVIGRELGGRSSGAVTNALARLSEAGVSVLTSDSPARYSLAVDAPAPSPQVQALMTPPVVTDERL